MSPPPREERGEISRLAGWALLALSLAVLFVYAARTSRTLLYRRVPVLKSPDVLGERVNEILAANRQPLTRAGSAAHFHTDGDQLHWKGARPPIEISPVRFCWRQSPRAMVASNFEHRVSRDYPPLTAPGMADVIADGSGRLIELVIVPCRVEPLPPRGARVDLRESENVVDEQEHVLLFDVAEILRHAQARLGGELVAADSESPSHALEAASKGADGERVN